MIDAARENANTGTDGFPLDGRPRLDGRRKCTPIPSTSITERLEYMHDSGIDGDPSAFEVTIVFEDLGKQTKVTMRSVFSSVAELERVKGFGAVEGGQQTLERLAEWLAAGHAGVAS